MKLSEILKESTHSKAIYKAIGDWLDKFSLMVIEKSTGDDIRVKVPMNVISMFDGSPQDIEEVHISPNRDGIDGNREIEWIPIPTTDYSGLTVVLYGPNVTLENFTNIPRTIEELFIYCDLNSIDGIDKTDIKN